MIIENINIRTASRKELMEYAEEQRIRNTRISFALKATRVGIWEWDTESEDIFISSECYDLLGYDKADREILFSEFLEKLHPDYRISKDTVVSEHVEAYPQNREIQLKVKSIEDKYEWIRIIGKLKSPPSKSRERVIIGTVENISTSKKLEIELLRYQKHLESLVSDRTKEIENQNMLLKERERAYSTLLKNLQGMAYRYLNDSNWTMLYVSEGCLKLTGYPKEKLMSGAVKMEEHILYKEYAEPIWNEITHALDNKKNFKVTYPIITKDNETKWVLDRGVGVYDLKGKLINLEGVIIDITEQKKQELQYKFAQKTIDNAPIAIQWIKEDGSYYYTNQATSDYSGYTKEEYSNIKIYDTDPLLNEKSWKQLFYERMTIPAKDIESSFLKKDGRSIPVLVNASNIEFEGVIYNCAYVNEISKLKITENKLKKAYDEIATSEEELRQRTEELNTLNDNLVVQKDQLEHTIIKLREAQDQLVNAEKMASLGVLVAGIAHELNNPINYLSTGGEGLKIVLDDVLKVVSKYHEITAHNIKTKLKEIEVLKKEVNYEELLTDMTKLVSNINMGSEQASEIIRGLKSFSKTDTGLLQNYNIHDGIDNVLLMLYNTFKYRIKIIKRYEDIPQVACHPTKLGQVFMNLISNAVQAIDGEGKIEVRTYLEEEYVIVEVKDTGPGISENIQNRIFEPFFTTKDTGKGTGLGLSISIGIIEDHKGKIDFFNNKDQGATFKIFLPNKRL